MKSTKTTNGNYLVTFTNGAAFTVYKSESLWWAKRVSSDSPCDCATSKAQVMRSLQFDNESFTPKQVATLMIDVS